MQIQVTVSYPIMHYVVRIIIIYMSILIFNGSHVMHVKALVLEPTVEYVVQIIIIGEYSFSITVMAVSCLI